MHQPFQRFGRAGFAANAGLARGLLAEPLGHFLIRLARHAQQQIKLFERDARLAELFGENPRQLFPGRHIVRIGGEFRDQFIGCSLGL